MFSIAYNDIKYTIGDGKHYNYQFYDAMNAKLKFVVDGLNCENFDHLTKAMEDADKNIIAVFGDKAANDFYKNEKDKEYMLLDFSDNDFTTVRSIDKIDDVVCCNAGNILLSMGVNDYNMQMDLSAFRDALRRIMNKACIMHKNVFLHTYKPYNTKPSNKIESTEYDKQLAEVANEYPNVCYLDLSALNIKDILGAGGESYNSRYFDSIYDMMNIIIPYQK